MPAILMSNDKQSSCAQHNGAACAGIHLDHACLEVPRVSPSAMLMGVHDCAASAGLVGVDVMVRFCAPRLSKAAAL